MTNNASFARHPGEGTLSLFCYAMFAFVSVLVLVGSYLAIQVFLSEAGSGIDRGQKPAKETAVGFAALEQGDRDAKLLELRKNLSRDRLDRRIALEISSLLAANGDSDGSSRLLLLTAERSLRDAGAQVQALKIYLQRGDVEKALRIMDGLIRSRPILTEVLFNQMLMLAASQKGEVGLAKLLSSNPPWRTALLSQATTKGTDPQQIYRLLLALKGTQSPPNDNELRLLLATLMSSKAYSQAYYVWLEMLGPESLRFAGNIYDGGFQSRPSNLYFGWNITATKTVEVKITPRSTGGADNSLRVDYIKNRESAAPVVQYMRIAPGEYIFSGDQRSEALSTEAGVNWQLSCLEGTAGIIARSPKLKGTSQWGRFNVRMIVPEDCSTQVLALVVASQATLDQQLDGSVFVDNVSVNRSDNAR